MGIGVRTWSCPWDSKAWGTPGPERGALGKGPFGEYLWSTEFIQSHSASASTSRGTLSKLHPETPFFPSAKWTSERCCEAQDGHVGACALTQLCQEPSRRTGDGSSPLPCFLRAARIA